MKFQDCNKNTLNKLLKQGYIKLNLGGLYKEKLINIHYSYISLYLFCNFDFIVYIEESIKQSSPNNFNKLWKKVKLTNKYYLTKLKKNEWKDYSEWNYRHCKEFFKTFNTTFLVKENEKRLFDNLIEFYKEYQTNFLILCETERSLILSLLNNTAEKEIIALYKIFQMKNL